MTKLQALNAFFSSFGLPAYEENSIYNPQFTPQLPYITYGISTSSFNSGEVSLSCSIWYRGDSSLQLLEQKADEMSRRLGYGGIQMKAADGFVWLKRGSPFAQYMGDPSDEKIKRAVINITAEFLTSA